MNTLTSNTLTDTHQLIESAIDDKLTELTTDKYTKIEFEWSNQFDTDIQHIGTIKLNGHSIPHQTNPSLLNYKEKQLPIICCCKSSTEHRAPGEFYNPRGLGVHCKTGHIFIADRDNNRIQVLSRNGDYLSTLGSQPDFNKPRGICINQDKLLVTDEHSVSMYDLNGRLIRRIGSKGNKEGEFNIPFGLDVCKGNYYIYVCDFLNDRVQILTYYLHFHSMLGIGVLKRPQDIKIKQDKIFVLAESDPCLFVFTLEHILINRLISLGEDKQLNNPGCFDVDTANNIIISDRGIQCVLVFNLKGEKIHEIGKKGEAVGEFVDPFGLAIDNLGRIIVICNKETASLQIF